MSITTQQLLILVHNTLRTHPTLCTSLWLTNALVLALVYSPSNAILAVVLATCAPKTCTLEPVGCGIVHDIVAH